MKWIGRFYLTLIFLCGIYTGKGQDILKTADSLYSIAEYEQSGLAYEWIIYSGGESNRTEKAITGKVNSLKKLYQYNKAIEYIDKVNTTGLSDSTRTNLMYESLLLNYLQKNYEEVQSRFLLSRFMLKASAYYQDASLLYSLSHLKSGDWEKGIKSSEAYIQMAASTEEREMLTLNFHELLDTLDVPKDKNPKTARILSMIIPGSGQIYAGYPIDGLTSFGLHALALGTAGLAFFQGLYITGWIGGFGVLQKLYFGGNHRAAHLAEQKNRLNKENFVQPALDLLISISEKDRT